MAEKLSRKKRFQELRDSIEKEALASQLDTEKEIKIAPTASKTLSHANKPVYPHEEVVTPTESTSNQVLDELLGEVKQYNISNGNRYTDDTQINILKQLDSSTPSARNQHIMPMEDDDENLGSTMEMPRTSSFSNDIAGVATFLPNQKLTRINPVEPEPEIFNEFSVKEETDEMAFEDYFKSTDDKIVLNSNDIRADQLQDTDHLDLFEPGKFSSEIDLAGVDNEMKEEEEEETPRLFKKKAKKEKKAKKPKKEKKAKPVVVEEEKEEAEVPSAKIRMQTSEVEEDVEKPNRTGTILNIILGILIIALLASIAFTVYFLWQMGR